MAPLFMSHFFEPLWTWISFCFKSNKSWMFSCCWFETLLFGCTLSGWLSIISSKVSWNFGSFGWSNSSGIADGKELGSSKTSLLMPTREEKRRKERKQSELIGTSLEFSNGNSFQVCQKMQKIQFLHKTRPPKFSLIYQKQSAKPIKCGFLWLRVK